MLTSTDLVQLEYKDSKPKYHGTFARPYFTFGQKDELETYTKEIKTQNDGEVKYELSRPKRGSDDKEIPTKHSATELFQATLAWFTERQNKEVTDSAKRVDPLFLILEDIESAEAAKARMARTAELKPADMDESIKKAAKSLMSAYPGKFTEEQALAKAKAMFEL